MKSRKHLSHAPTGRIAPDHDIAKTQLLRHCFDIFDVVFDEIRAFQIPIGIPMPAHIHGHHVIA